MSKRDYVRSLAALCRRFGGRLAIISQECFDDLFEDITYPTDGTYGLSESPFTSAHGIHWERKIIYVVRDREEVGSIIHEMGHVFADLLPPDHEHACEWSWLGWEIAVARDIGAGRVWSRQNANYQTGSHGNWGSLTAIERRAVVVDRLTHANKLNIIDSSGAPRNIR